MCRHYILEHESAVERGGSMGNTSLPTQLIRGKYFMTTPPFIFLFGYSFMPPTTVHFT